MREFTIYVMEDDKTYELDYEVDLDGLSLVDVKLNGESVRKDLTFQEFRNLYVQCIDDAWARLCKKPGYRWLGQASMRYALSG